MSVTSSQSRVPGEPLRILLRRKLLRCLPFGIQNRLRRAKWAWAAAHSRRYRRRFRGALSLPPTVTNPASSVEIQTILCHRDVLAYLYAVKSLLLYSQDFCVTVHDDGTLSDSDLRLIQHQLKGVRVISRAEADAEVLPKLESYPSLASYRRTIVTALQVLDFGLLGRAPKRISLDADILFLDRPAELLDWMSGNGPELLVGQEKGWTSEQDRRLGATPLEFFPNINIGLMCFDQDLVDLKRVDEIIRCMPEAPSWITSQIIFAVLIQDFARLHPGQVQYLSGDRYLHTPPLDRKAVMKHYWSVRRTGVGWPLYEEDLRKIHAT